MNETTDALSFSLTLEEASLRFSKHVQKYNKLVDKDNRKKIDESFLTNLTMLSKKELIDKLPDSPFIEHASCAEIARKGYDQDSLVKHRLALVVNAFDLTFKKDRVPIAQIIGYGKDPLTQSVLETFQERDPFYKMIANHKAEKMPEVMKQFSESLPELPTKQLPAQQLTVYSLKHEKPGFGARLALLVQKVSHFSFSKND